MVFCRIRSDPEFWRTIFGKVVRQSREHQDVGDIGYRRSIQGARWQGAEGRSGRLSARTASLTPARWSSACVRDCTEAEDLLETIGDYSRSTGRARNIRWQGRAIDLTPSEFELLLMSARQSQQTAFAAQDHPVARQSEGSVAESRPRTPGSADCAAVWEQGVEAPIRTVWADGDIFDLPDE